MNENRTKRLKTTNNESNNQESSSKDENSLASDQLNDLVVLKYSTKEWIITSLIKLISLLHGKLISNETKIEMMKDNDELILALASLPKKSIQASDSALSLENSLNNDLVLDVSRETRLKLIDNLINNRAILSSSSNLITAEFKTNLIEKNNKLIIHLLDLKTRLIQITNETNTSIESDEIKENGTSNDQSISKDEIDKMQTDIDALKNVIKYGIKSKPEAVIKCDLKDIKNFFAKEEKLSFKFFCQGISFCVRFCVEDTEEDDITVKYLSIFLHCEHDSKDNWSIATKYDLKLLNQKSKMSDKIVNYEYTFKRKGDNYGSSDFIEYHRLIDQENGWLNDENKIQIEVCLKADKLIKHLS